MDMSDMFVNDLIYYKQLKNDIEKQLKTNDIEKKILTNSIKKKIITLPLKKRPTRSTSKKKGTFYMIERDVYYE